MLLLLLRATALLPAAAVTPGSQARDTVNFDFGWRYAPVQEQRYLAQCTFVENMNYGQGNIAAVNTEIRKKHAAPSVPTARTA